MYILSSMDMPTMDVDLGPERMTDQKVEVGDPLMYCDLCDTEVVHKLAQMLLPGLATACVDSTSGDLFKSPGSVAVDLRKEMIDNVTQRTELFVAESVILEGGPDGKEPDHPFDIISNFVDDFASSKSNLFTKVSGWLLSDKREDKIDDFIQEMEMTNFWTLDRRESVAETFLKNVDFENKFNCGSKFNSVEEFVNHVNQCNFRTVICENEGCNAKFTAGHLEKHDLTCPFKIIQCEQKCSDSIMRRHMDRHCITVCPMKLVNCPFYAVGCRCAIAQCLLEKHRSDDIGSHLWHLLKGKYREVSGEDLQRRVQQILQASSVSRLAEARDVRSLNFILKEIEAKLGPLEVTVIKDSAETITKTDGEGIDNNTKGSEPSIETVSKNDDEDDSDNSKKGIESSTKAPDMVNSTYKTEEVSDIINMNKPMNTVMPDVVSSSEKVEGVSDIIDMNKPMNTAMLDVVSSSDNDKAEVSDIFNIDSSENSSKNKDDQHSHKSGSENSPKNKDSKHSHTESSSENTLKSKDGKHSYIQSKGSDERTQIPNMDSLPNETEVSIVNNVSAHIYNKDRDSASTEVKNDGNQDNTQTNTEILTDKEEINATNEDGEKKKSKKKHATDSSSSSSSEDDKDDEKMKLKQKRKMKNKGNAEHYVKNKDNEDYNFEDSLQDSEV